MTGKEATLAEFFYGTEPIIIPVYQRNYTWKKNDCKQLLDDILSIADDKEKTHFIGSIVHVKHSDGNIIIDGQQRITTLSILLLAIRNAILAGDITTQNDTLTQEIEYQFLINQFSKDKDRRMKLKPFRDDCKAFDALFVDKSSFILESLITENYSYFYEELVVRAIDPQKLYDAIKRLVFVRITLEPSHGDNAQQIFESINSTGVRLTETDKIRNFVLMNLDAKTQEHYYNNYWLQIEKNTDLFLEDYMRDYLTMMCKAIPNKSDVYRVFKEYTSENFAQDIEPLLESLKHYSLIFRSIKECKVGSSKANAIMANLEQLDISTTYPFLLPMLNYKIEGEIDDQEVERVLQTLEVFLFRRIMMGYYNTGLNKVFYNMHTRILKTQHGDWKYSDVLIYLLQHGISYFDFPKDEEFKKSFEERDVYKMKSNYRLYFFCTLEESLNKEAVGVKEKIENGILSIEHVMPQKLTDDWRHELGPDFTQEDYEKWINNIGNLTLTAYNSEYSNRKFIEKRDGVPSLPDMKGFKDSCVAMNKYISLCDHWTIKEMETRCKKIAAHAIKIWPYPTTDFLPMVIEDEFIPIDADYKFKGRDIKSYTFNGATVTVDSWADAFTRIVRSLYEMDASILHHLAHDKGEAYYSVVPQYGYNKIAEGVHLCVACGTNAKLRQIHRLLDMYKLEPDDISVALYPPKKTNIE
jgi:uncharacterized protein with ParB-like and HNH nuclease domain